LKLLKPAWWNETFRVTLGDTGLGHGAGLGDQHGGMMMMMMMMTMMMMMIPGRLYAIQIAGF